MSLYLVRPRSKKNIKLTWRIFRTGTLNGSPCGMNPGNTTLDLSAKDKLNVTWHLGYPHKGKYLGIDIYDNKIY